MKIENALVLSRRFDQHRARAVAKKHAGAAVAVVEDRGHLVAADDQRFAMRARADKLRSHRQRVEKARARSRQVKAPRVRGANSVLHQAGRGRKQHVGCYRSHDDQVDLVSGCVSLFQELLRRGRREVRRGHVFLGHVPFGDPGSFADPLVSCGHDLFQIRITQHAWRQVTGHSGDLCGDAFPHFCDSPVWKIVGRLENPRLYAIANGVTSNRRCRVASEPR